MLYMIETTSSNNHETNSQTIILGELWPKLPSMVQHKANARTWGVPWGAMECLFCICKALFCGIGLSLWVVTLVTESVFDEAYWTIWTFNEDSTQSTNRAWSILIFGLFTFDATCPTMFKACLSKPLCETHSNQRFTCMERHGTS